MALYENEDLIDKSTLRQRYLETSNVQVVEEMVKLKGVTLDYDTTYYYF